MRGKRRLGLVVLVTATAGMVLGSLPPTAAAAAAAPHLNTDRVAHLTPAGHARTSGSGGVAGDIDGDGWADVLGERGNGDLVSYRHSRDFHGTDTYPTAVTINSGWGMMRWVGVGDLDADGYADVLGITWDSSGTGGAMAVARNSGTFDGMRTLEPGLRWIGEGWGDFDLISPVDFNGDGFADLIARKAGTGDTYYYENQGGINGGATFAAPVLLVTGGQDDVYQGMADLTEDGNLDLVFVQSNGVLGVFDLANGTTYAVGWGWEGINAVVLTDVNADGAPDILGRVAGNGNLQAYRHIGSWNPDNPYVTYAAPVVVGHNWGINTIIT